MVTWKDNKNEIATTDRTVVPFHLMFNKNEKGKLEWQTIVNISQLNLIEAAKLW